MTLTFVGGCVRGPTSSGIEPKKTFDVVNQRDTRMKFHTIFFLTKTHWSSVSNCRSCEPLAVKLLKSLQFRARIPKTMTAKSRQPQESLKKGKRLAADLPMAMYYATTLYGKVSWEDRRNAGDFTFNRAVFTMFKIFSIHDYAGGLKRH